METVTVTSGTPGVGRTTVAINLAVALGQLQRRVVLLEVLPGPSVVARWLGVPVRPAAARGLHIRDNATRVQSDGPHGVRILTPLAGLTTASLPRAQLSQLIASTRARGAEPEFLIVDTAISVLGLARVVTSSDRIVLVTTVDKTATNCTSRLVRRMHRTGCGEEIGVVVNGVTSRGEAEDAHRVIAVAAGRGRGGHVEAYGSIAVDPDVPRSQMMQRAVVDCRPHSPSSRSLATLARRIAHGEPSGGGVSQLPQRARHPSQRWAERQKCA